MLYRLALIGLTVGTAYAVTLLTLILSAEGVL